MLRRIVLVSLVAAGVGLTAGASAPARAADRVWFGGGIGLAFGDVDYVSVEPMVGVRVAPKVSVGGRLVYRYRKDDRYADDLSTSDYGGSLFARYRVGGPLFVQGEYERLSYEYRVSGGTERDDFDGLFGGVGISQPLGGRASFFAVGLYNFSYDSGTRESPYSEPWVFRAGVGFGF
jgi:hypothetical protein